MTSHTQPVSLVLARCCMAALLLMLGACEAERIPQQQAAAVTQPQMQMQMYLSPHCGCCGDWADHIEAAGIQVTRHYVQDPLATRRQLGVPDVLGSCHTAIIDGYRIEGHVPAADIYRLLEERPAASGLAVPGMPIGSPGMEMDGRQDPYQVLLFNQDGVALFSSYP